MCDSLKEGEKIFCEHCWKKQRDVLLQSFICAEVKMTWLHSWGCHWFAVLAFRMVWVHSIWGWIPEVRGLCPHRRLWQWVLHGPANPETSRAQDLLSTGYDLKLVVWSGRLETQEHKPLSYFVHGWKIWKVKYAKLLQWLQKSPSICYQVQSRLPWSASRHHEIITYPVYTVHVN